MLTTEEKAKIINDNKTHKNDTGSPEVQIAILTEKINYLTAHMTANKKDYHTKTGLMRMVGRRKRLLEYLKQQDVKRYESLIKKLKLRK